MVCCKCRSQMFWCVDTHRKEGYRWWCRRVTCASAFFASKPISHGSWFRQSNLNFTDILFLTYDIVRRVPAQIIRRASVRLHISPTSRSWHSVTHCHSIAQICPVPAQNTAAFGLQISMDDVTRSFVFYARHKRLNLQTAVPLPNGVLVHILAVIHAVQLFRILWWIRSRALFVTSMSMARIRNLVF